MGALDKKSEQIYIWMRSYIDENKFADNSKLPSENVISHRLKVSRETVRTGTGQAGRRRTDPKGKRKWNLHK